MKLFFIFTMMVVMVLASVGFVYGADGSDSIEEFPGAVSVEQQTGKDLQEGEFLNYLSAIMQALEGLEFISYEQYTLILETAVSNWYSNYWGIECQTAP